MIKILDYEGKLVSENKRLIKTRQGRFAISKEYRVIKAAYMYSAKNIKLEKPYKIRIEAKTRKDIDNIIKPLLDSLEAKKVIENDRYVTYLEVSKKKVGKGEKESVQVYAIDL